MKHHARGGFAMGLIVGLLVGLGLALGVALYVTKVPVPLVQGKVQQRNAEQDAAEAERNKSWDPNAGLGGKAAQRPAAAGQAPREPVADSSPADPVPVATAPAPATQPKSAMPLPVPVQVAKPPVQAASGVAAAASRPARPARDPNAILAGAPVPDANAPSPREMAASVVARSAKPGADPFVYFVQAGAFSREEDAEAQRAKLALQGFGAKLTEREQAGRVVYRVRLGPFDHREDAETSQAKLQSAGSEAALVRIFRQ